MFIFLFLFTILLCFLVLELIETANAMTENLKTMNNEGHLYSK